MTKLAQALGTTSSFNEFLATPINFSAFMLNRLNIQHLAQDMLTGPTYDLIKGTCKRVVELEYHLEEVFKATNDQLDWHNPEGRPYPHDLSKPLPLIPDARGPLIIPYDRFINNDLEYLPRQRLLITVILNGLKTRFLEVHGVRHKSSTTNTPTEEHITGDQNVRDSMYMLPTWKLRKTSIQNTGLLLLQVSRSWNSLGKLTNLNMDERFALNVALRMYTRRIVIQERVEDLQLAVESYQKKINLTKPDTYRSDICKKTPYTAYHDIQGVIYQDDMNRNRLMRTDELYKFSDGTLNHVRTSLNDIATGIQMEYLPKRKWSKQDKQRA
ncbi:hypothetical protein Tco_1394446 [Tanacetum coccineum]